MRKNLQRLRSQLVYLPATLRLVWQAAHWWTAVWSVLLLLEGILPAVSVYLTRLLVDSLAAALGAGTDWVSIRPTLIWAGLIALVMLLTQLLQGLTEYVRIAQSELVQDYLSEMVHAKSIAVDLAFYESAEYQDRLYRASQDLKDRPLALLESGGSLIQNGITLLAMASILLPYGVWLPLLLIVSTAPALYVVLRYNRVYHRWWERTTPDRRWLSYFNNVLTLDLTAADLRLFRFGEYFQNAYQTMRARLRQERLDMTRQQSLSRLLAGLLAGVMSGTAVAWMVWRAFLGFFTLGDLALFYQAFNRGQSLLRTLLSSAGRVYENILFLENLFEFFAQEPHIADPPHPVPTFPVLRQGIHLRQVSFRYPGSEKFVFHNFDFFVPAGKIVAIVGANGAGKSTLVKLLCRFYDPEDGAVLFDGVDVRQFSLTALRRMITSMFQRPVPYISTVRENIALGDLAANPTQADVELAARRAGAHEFISRLPQGYETLLGKLFANGLDLSGGEWQRLALARSFLRQAPIMILDEPTSMMDSWAELDWFDRFQELAAGRTAILITHRLMTARRADVIHVMDAGSIIESGTHEELLVLNGRYAQSWLAQLREPVPAAGNGRLADAMAAAPNPLPDVA